MTEATNKTPPRDRRDAYTRRMEERGLIRISVVVPDDEKLIGQIRRKAATARDKHRRELGL